MSGEPRRRPFGVTAIALFFAFGAAASGASLVSLVWRGGPLEPMWRLNPRAREALASMGTWGLALLLVVGVACALAAAGLWRLRPWGHRLAAGLLLANAAGGIANTAFGSDRRAAAGLPIAGLLIVYLLSSRVRRLFGASRADVSRNPQPPDPVSANID